MARDSPIDISSGDLHVRILPRGAALVGVRFEDDPRNLVLGFEDPADHARVPIYAGALVGPVANRVRGGVVDVDGTRWQMPLNEAGRTTLHSGDDGLHAQLWRVTELDTDRVTLTCTLEDGTCGLPGLRRFVAEYAVEGTCLTVTLQARTDAATPINLASHPYWNLDGGADISGHSLQVQAAHYLPTDADNLPTGERAPVAGTAFDFTAPAPVPLTPELDVNFCLTDATRPDPQHAATLTGSDGTTLDIATTAPGLQVYNGGFLPSDAPATPDFPQVQPFAAIALEPQHWPDAPTHADFPNIILWPDDHYRQQTRYTLSRR